MAKKRKRNRGIYKIVPDFPSFVLFKYGYIEYSEHYRISMSYIKKGSKSEKKSYFIANIQERINGEIEIFLSRKHKKEEKGGKGDIGSEKGEKNDREGEQNEEEGEKNESVWLPLQSATPPH